MTEDREIVAVAWSPVAGEPGAVTDLTELLVAIEDNQHLRSALLADALSQLKGTLQATESFQKPLSTPVTISLGNAALIARHLLGRFR